MIVSGPSTDVSDVEMQPLTENPFDDHQGRQNTPQHRDPNAILNDCREIGRAIDELENELQDLQRVQRSFLTGSGTTNSEVDAKGADIMSGYRSLADRVKRIKSQPGAFILRRNRTVSKS